MVDRYYRKTNNVENDIQNSMQISSILLKLKNYDKKLEGLSKIDTNEGDISSNSGKINDNSNDISSNLRKTNDNTNDILNNLGNINDNTNDIVSNLGKINDNSNDIVSNLEKIDNFKKYISESGNHFNQNHIIKKQIFKFNRNTHFYTIFEKEIVYDFTKNSLLFIDINIHYKYENLLNDYYRLQHQYDIYDDEDNLIHKYLFNKDTYYDGEKTPILLTIDNFCIFF